MTTPLKPPFTFTARRVLTTTGTSGKSQVLADGEPSDSFVLNGCRMVRLWQTNEVPATVPATEDVTAKSLGPMPRPFEGTRFYTAELPGGANGARIPLHRADLVDYIGVIKGRLTLVLEDRELELGPGDTVVQCGNMHGWENRSPEPCVIMVVSVGAKSAV
jgi:quercetin dioxygenase-like cupin family protein